MANDISLRQTAYRLWLSDLLKGEFFKSPGEFQPSYVVVNGVNVSRVNVIGIIISKNQKEGYSSITIDDGSALVQARVWRDDVRILNDFEVGNIILMLAKVKSFNNRIYLVPEFIRKLENPDWFKLRKLELEKKYGKAERIENAVEAKDEEYQMPANDLEAEDIGFVAVQEETVSDAIIENVNDKRQKMMRLIESEDINEGADTAVVISKSGLGEAEAQALIDELLREGEIFEIKPGRIRTLI